MLCQGFSRLPYVVAGVIISIVSAAAYAAAPLGSTPHTGGVTFRVWAPYVEAVAVKINDGAPVPMAKEPGHTDPGDATWMVEVPSAKVGDKYKYAVTYNGNTAEYVDPRARQLTDYTAAAASVVVDTAAGTLAPFTVPALNSLVIYEMHIGSFNPNEANEGKFDFAGAKQKLDYLQSLGINAVELLPVNETVVGGGGGGRGGRGRGARGGAATQQAGAATQPAAAAATQPVAGRAGGRAGAGGRGDYNWGYDPASYYALKTSYGTPAQLKDFVNAAHARGIAVFIDVVYNHMHSGTLLRNWGGFTNAEYPNGFYFNNAARGASPWGPRPDFSRPQVLEHLRDNALMFVTEYGVDGLRWDSTGNIRAFRDRDAANTPNAAGQELIRSTLNEYRKTQPQKIMIAEDLFNTALVTQPTAQGGLGFNSQWDNDLCAVVRKTVVGEDKDRNLSLLKTIIEVSNRVADFGKFQDGQDVVASHAAGTAKKTDDDPFARVIFTENHDEAGHGSEQKLGVPNVRVPAAVDPRDPQSVKAKKLSTLASAVMLTTPGVPMLFQGQEMLDPREFTFGVNIPMQWNRVESQRGIIKMYSDMIRLRRNVGGKTAGLTGKNVNVYHVNDATHTLAYHRWDKGGAGDDVIVVTNFSGNTIEALNVGFPSAGKWTVRFNSGSSSYDPAFENINMTDVSATNSPADGQAFSGKLAIAPYSAIILSRD